MLRVSKEEILNYFILYLKDRYPELDLRRGTAVRDLVLDPLADLFQEVMSSFYALYLFLRGEYPDPNDDFYQKAIENIAKNFFVYRRRGQKAAGLIRVYVAKKKYYRVPKGTKFYITPNMYYEAPEEFTFLPNQLYYNALEGAWYFEVPAVAPEIGADYNLPANSKVEVEPFDPHVLYAETATDFVGGTDIEPLDQFVERIKQELTVRNMVSPRSIKVVLPQKIDNILFVQPIGFGDPEMWRDYKEFETVKLHVGGHVDVYVKFMQSTPPKEVELTVGKDGWVEYPGMLHTTDGSKIVNTDLDISFSYRSKIQVDKKEGEKVKVLAWPEIKIVQELLDRSDLRILTANYLARIFFPVYLEGKIEAAIPPNISDAEIKEKLDRYIWHYHSPDMGFQISDLVAFLYNELGAKYVKTPTLTARVIGPDYQERVITFDDVLELPKEDNELSTRTITYYNRLEVVRI